MKKLIIAAILALPFIAKSQAVVLKANGFVDAKDSTKNYVVIDQPKMKQIELYKKTLTYLNSIYNNPTHVLTSVEGESITVKGGGEKLIMNIGLYEYPYSYSILLQFKDGKIKYEPSLTKIEQLFTVNNQIRPFYVASTDSPKPVEINCIYMLNKDKNGYFVFQDDIKDSLDKFFNKFIVGIKDKLSENW